MKKKALLSTFTDMYKSAESMDKHFLMIPKNRREEVLNLKSDMQDYNQIKNQCMLVNKRDRQLKGGWRNGVIGIESPEDPDTQIYVERAKLLLNKQLRKTNTEKSRATYIRARNGTSSQISFNNSIPRPATHYVGKRGERSKQRNGRVCVDSVADIAHGWTRKASTNRKRENTYTHLFNSNAPHAQDPSRKLYLLNQDRRG